LPARSYVPVTAPGGNAEVPPALGDTHFADIEVSGYLSVLDEQVGELVVAVAEHDVFTRRTRCAERLKGGPWGQVEVFVVEVVTG
jgi:hypothetical protein